MQTVESDLTGTRKKSQKIKNYGLGQHNQKEHDY